MSLRTNLKLFKRAAAELKHCRNVSMELTPEQAEVRSVCRNFADNNLAPTAGQLDTDQRFPYAHIKSLADMGLMRLCVSRENGGAGRDMLSLALAVEELSRGCASTGFVYSIHNSLFANLVDGRGTEGQKREFLQELPLDAIGAFALSEPEAGSDVANIQTRIVEDGDDFIINGSKFWVTNAIESRAIVVFGTVNPELKHRGMACFLVPSDFPGVFKGNKEYTLGVRAASVCSVRLEEVRLPRRYLVGEIGEGFRIAMQQLLQSRIGIAAHATGIAQAALDLALRHSTERTAFGRPLLRHHSIQDRLADMSILVETARLLTWRAAVDRSTKNSAMAKYVATRNASAVVDHCVQILGGLGLSKMSPAERHYRDARGTQIYGGVTDVQKMLVGNSLIAENLGAAWLKRS